MSCFSVFFLASLAIIKILVVIEDARANGRSTAMKYLSDTSVLVLVTLAMCFMAHADFSIHEDIEEICDLAVKLEVRRVKEVPGATPGKVVTVFNSSKGGSAWR